MRRSPAIIYAPPYQGMLPGQPCKWKNQPMPKAAVQGNIESTATFKVSEAGGIDGVRLPGTIV